MSWIAGVDGFRAKWCVVLQNLETGEFRARIEPDFRSLLAMTERPHIVCVDIPIGLPVFTSRGGRTCERLARQMLGRRASTVFSAVGRGALLAQTRPDADSLSRSAGGLGVGAQAWGLSQKLKAADGVMTPEHQEIVHEVHPEVSFWAMNGQAPVMSPKRTPQGASDRIELLQAGGLQSTLVRSMPQGLRVGRDDFLDACAALWTAGRIFNGTANRIPETPDLDDRGLDQAIWF